MEELLPGLLFLGRNHFRDPADSRVACIYVAVRIHGHVVGFVKLAGPRTGSLANRTEYVAIPVQLNDLAIFSRRHPKLAVGVHIEGASEISHLNRFHELAVSRIDDEAILLPITDPDVAGFGINGDPMGHAESSLSDTVTEPLIYEFAILIEMYYARGTNVVGWIS